MEPEAMDHLAQLLVVRLRERPPNLGTVERTARILGGSSAMAVGGALIHAAVGAPQALLASLVLILLGINFVASGARGYCPLYKRLDWSTAHPQPRADGSRSTAGARLRIRAWSPARLKPRTGQGRLSPVWRTRGRSATGKE